MTKVITEVETDSEGNISKVVYDEEYIAPAIMSLKRNNTFFPNIKNIIVNGNFTKMFFVDGTSVSVKRSDADPANLDAAIAFCVFKRLYGKPDANGNIEGDGFTTFIKKTVHEKVFDQAKHDKEVCEVRTEKQAEKRRLEAENKNDKVEKCHCDHKCHKNTIKRSFCKPNRNADGKFSKRV